jgi:LDH2 family malate/lactate/ureidoglycolate dehydrogenase
MIKTLHYKAEELRDYMIRFFTTLGVPKTDAAIASDVLLSADMRGVSSHGIIRLNTYYGSRLRQGLVNPNSPVTILSETLTSLALDGGNGLGQVVSYHAMQRCIEKARQVGVAMVTVRNSNHYGIAGYYAMMALSHDMIGISFTNSQPLVAPTYGRTRILGTNPIAVAAPAMNQQPYVLDMATSIVPLGRIQVYEKSGMEIPPGWGIDSSGNVTTQPGQVAQGGALLPLGGTDEMRGYKGYGLSLLVDIFAGVLSGAAFASHVGRVSADAPANVGHFFAAVRIDAFRPVEEFKQSMDQLIQELKDSPKAEGQERIYIHGEKEFERAARCEVEGVPLMENIVASLRQNGEEIGVPFDLTPVGEGQQSDEDE